MGEAAKALGKPSSVTYQGKVYTLSPFDVDAIAEFEVWLENRAWQGVERQKDRLTLPEYERRLAIVNKQIAAGEFNYGSEAAAAAAKSIAGQKYLIYLQLRFNPEMTPELAGEIWEHELAQLRAKMAALNDDGGGADDPLAKSPPPAAGTT